MAKKRRFGNPSDLKEIGDALLHLKKARDSLRRAGAKKSADAVARALKSAEGAQRHAYHSPMQALVRKQVTETMGAPA